jgi:hypothetical protein
MSAALAVLVYVAAMAVPAWLLYYFGSRAWYWHALAIAAGMVLGLIPSSPTLGNPTGELLTGFVFVFLMVWGIGGLLMVRPHHEKHA